MRGPGLEPGAARVRLYAMMSSKTLRFSLFGLLILALAACDDGETTDLSTTSSLVSSPTTAGEVATTTTVAPGGDTTSTTLVGQPVAELRSRGPSVRPGRGDALHRYPCPGIYRCRPRELRRRPCRQWRDHLRRRDLQRPGAVDAYRKPEAERTEGETQLIDQHHFASVQNGTTVVYRGRSPTQASSSSAS